MVSDETAMTSQNNLISNDVSPPVLACFEGMEVRWIFLTIVVSKKERKYHLRYSLPVLLVK